MNKEFNNLWICHLYFGKDSCITSQIELIANLNCCSNNELVLPAPKTVLPAPKIKIRFLPSIDFKFLSSLIFSIELFFYLPYYLLKTKEDFLILDQGSFFGSFSSLILKKLRILPIKFILDVRSIPVEAKGIHSILFKLQYYFAMIFGKYFCDGITFLTERMAKEECKKFGITNKPIGIWTSGVNEELFNPNKYKSTGKTLRNKLGLENKFVIFYHGVLSPNRGLQNTVRAIKLIEKDYPEVVLFLLGNGRAKEEINNLIKENKLENKVILRDSVNYTEVPKYISMMDAGIVPLPHHPFWINQSPLKVMEYLAMGKPIILTNIPAHKDIIGKEKCGIFIKSHEPKEIAKGIIKAYNQRRSLSKISIEGRKIILVKYTWKKIAKNLENFLKNGIK